MKFVGGTPLEGSAQGQAVGNRLSEMFDDRVDTDRKSSVLMTIQFVNSALWVLARKGASAAEGFDSRVSANQFTLGWYLDQQKKPYFVGFALPEDILFKKEFVLGDANKTHLVVTPSEPGAKLRNPWEVRQLAVHQSYSKLPFPKTSIQVRNGHDLVVDAIAARRSHSRKLRCRSPAPR